MVVRQSKTKQEEQEQPYDELWVSLPRGKIAEVDEAKGPYFTRSKFVLYALDRAIQEAKSGTLRIENKNSTSLGASGDSPTPNVVVADSSSNITPNNSPTTTPSTEVTIDDDELGGLAGVS